MDGVEPRFLDFFFSPNLMASLSQFTFSLPLVVLALGSCAPSVSEEWGGSAKELIPLPYAQNSSRELTVGSTPSQLNLAEACGLAIQHHPSLATYPMDLRASDARVLKATRMPNPEVGFDGEDFFGTDETRGLRSAVFNAQITQVLETGGKRQARQGLAQAERSVMLAEYGVKRLEVIMATSEQYLEAVAAQEELSFLRAGLQRERETVELVSAMVAEGRGTEAADQQAKVSLVNTELEIATAEQARKRALRALALQWGDASGRDYRLAAALGGPAESLSSASGFRGELGRHPKRLLAEAKVAEAQAAEGLARANQHSDIALTGGLRYNNADDDSSALVGVSLPLPLFDRKQDEVVESRALIEKAQLEVKAASREVDNEFSLAWADLASARELASKVERDLLPAATRLFRSAEGSFREGKFTALEYLSAQKQFYEVRSRWLESRLEYQLAAARVQALTNQSL